MAKQPTQPTTPNDALLREVDDDLRAERMQQFWRRYRQPILMVLVGLILFVGGTSLWEQQQAKKAGEAMLKLDAGMQALQQDKPKEAAEQFAALAKDSRGTLNDVARLWQARALIAAEQAEQAIAVLTDLAEKPAGADLVWRDLACLRLMGAGADAPAACRSEAASPLASTRTEWEAARLWQLGKAEEAKALLERVAKDEAAPRDQRTRARTLQQALAAEVK